MSAKLQKCEKGALLVELAVVLPVLVFMMVLIAQVGVLVNARLVLGEAARESSREYATYALDGSGLCDQGLERAILRADTIASSLPGHEGFYAGGRSHFALEPGGAHVTVTVSYLCPVFVPGIGRLLSSEPVLDGSSVLITGSATFYKELRGVLD